MLPLCTLLTGPDGDPLTDADLALLRRHPRLARLVVKAVKAEAASCLPPRLRALQIEAWGLALLAAPERPFFTPDLLKTDSPKGLHMRLSFDFLGDLLGKARRRRLETQARQGAQAALDANKEALVRLALGTINAMPEDSAPAALHLIAQTLLTQALASPPVLARVPAGARPALAGAVMQALAGVPLPDPIRAGAVGTFQINAKTSIATAIRALTL